MRLGGVELELGHVNVSRRKLANQLAKSAPKA
jgi:hypothetical protein